MTSPIVRVYHNKFLNSVKWYVHKSTKSWLLKVCHITQRNFANSKYTYKFNLPVQVTFTSTSSSGLAQTEILHLFYHTELLSSALMWKRYWKGFIIVVCSTWSKYWRKDRSGEILDNFTGKSQYCVTIKF